MRADELRVLLALEPSWTISINGKEFVHVRSSEVEVNDSALRFGAYIRKIVEIDMPRTSVLRVRARARLRRETDVFVFYSGEKLPSGADLRRRRSSFQRTLAPALCSYFGMRVTRQLLHSDKQHGVGGAYPRFLLGRSSAVIAVDPDESGAVVNGIMRAAIQWAAVVRRRVSVVIPAGRSGTLVRRLDALPSLRRALDWLTWDGERLSALPLVSDHAPTEVCPYWKPDVEAEVARICAAAPGLLQAIPQIAGRAVSVRFRGLEVARVTEEETTYPLGEPLTPLVEHLARERCAGSRSPLARAHEEAWLESNLISQLRDVLPVRQDHIYPQVPSFGDNERKVIDLLTITDAGRLVVIEIKVVSDPDLPLQALDYWLAVERHRKAGDFQTNGYFGGMEIRDEPALLVLVAPLLSFHRMVDRLLATMPPSVPLVEIGINQGWKREIKVLRRKGTLR